VPIKLRILLCVLGLQIIGFGLLIAYQASQAETAMAALRTQQVAAVFDASLREIDATTGLIERSVLDLATAGETFHLLAGSQPADSLEAPIRRQLIAHFERFPAALTGRLRAKLGLHEARDEDRALIDDWLKLLATEKTDHTIAWRRLAGYGAADPAPVRDLFLDRAAFDAWAARYAARLAAEGSVDAERAARMKRVNPKFVLRNHLCEVAIRAAEAGDFTPTQELLKVLQRPYDEQPEWSAYADFPPDWAQSIEVSCSS